jgi:hypothetical protein
MTPGQLRRRPGTSPPPHFARSTQPIPSRRALRVCARCPSVSRRLIRQGFVRASASHVLAFSPFQRFRSRSPCDAVASSGASIILPRPTLAHRPIALEPIPTSACPSRAPWSVAIHQRSIIGRHRCCQACDPRRPAFDTTRTADSWSVPSHA